MTLTMNRGSRVEDVRWKLRGRLCACTSEKVWQLYAWQLGDLASRLLPLARLGSL